MSIKTIGSIDGVKVEEITLHTASGATASILSWGATVRDLAVPVGNESRHVVLGYRDLDSYCKNRCYLGATAGRYANRIADGRFTLEGKLYQLSLNEGGTHLHGGVQGFSMRPWQVVEHGDSFVTLALTAKDGDQGYPGTVQAQCRYSLDDPAALRIEMTATTDAPTLVNLAHHSYFCLGAGNSRDHALWINARFITPTDEKHIPSGEILSVAGTPFDFTEMRRVGSLANDYDINYVIDRNGDGPILAASVLSPESDLRLDVLTTEPGIQLYNGFALPGEEIGLDGKIIPPYAGLCLEPQKFPNAPNLSHFPSARLNPGEEYRQITEYRFVSLA